MRSRKFSNSSGSNGNVNSTRAASPAGASTTRAR